MKPDNYFLQSTLFVGMILLAIRLEAQSGQYIKDPELHNEVIRMDSLLFNVAFNTCDFELWKSIMNEDLEFYDDRQGLNTSFEVEIESFLNRCSKDFKVTRKLINTEIYPLNDYGAVQLGEHEFYIDGELGEIAKFVHIWQKTGDQWAVTRVVSYDHKPAR